jgi:A/G-specific adenine glycosylase
MNKRGENDIWANMYDLPLIETTSLMPLDQLITLPEVVAFFGKNIQIAESLTPKKHVLTHQHLHVRFIKLQSSMVKIHTNWVFIEVEKIKKLALPKVIFIFLDNFLN